MVIAKWNNSENVSSFADSEKEAIGIICYLTEGDGDIYLYDNTNKLIKIIKIRG